jgi:hypothetical protein
MKVVVEKDVVKQVVVEEEVVKMEKDDGVTGSGSSGGTVEKESDKDETK